MAPEPSARVVLAIQDVRDFIDDDRVPEGIAAPVSTPDHPGVSDDHHDMRIVREFGARLLNTAPDVADALGVIVCRDRLDVERPPQLFASRQQFSPTLARDLLTIHDEDVAAGRSHAINRPCGFTGPALVGRIQNVQIKSPPPNVVREGGR